MKKKLLIMLTTCAMVFTMCACGASEDAANANESSDAATVSEENTDAVESTDAAEIEATDDSAAEVTGTLTFDIPEGFVEGEENFYNCEDTTKGSNFNYLTQPNDGSFDAVSADVLLAATETQLESMYDVDVTFNLLEESFYEIGANRAFRYSMEYELSGIKVVQLQCIIEDPETLHFVTYTEINDEGFLDAFKASADSIRFE